MSKVKWNTPIIEIPNEFNFITKNGLIKSGKPLNKSGNLASRNKQKSIKIEINKDIDHIEILNQGEKIDKVKKERKPRAKTAPQPEIKKPTIKVSNPLIEDHKINNTTTPLNYENELINLIKDKFNNKKIESENDEREFSIIFENYYSNKLKNNDEYKKLRNEIKKIWENIQEIDDKKRKTKLDKELLEKLFYTDLKEKNIKIKKIDYDILYDSLLKIKEFWGPYINKESIKDFTNSGTFLFSFIRMYIDFNKVNDFLNIKKPTIKVSNPLIEDHKINNTTTPLNYENKKYKFTNNDDTELIKNIINKIDDIIDKEGGPYGVDQSLKILSENLKKLNVKPKLLKMFNLYQHSKYSARFKNTKINNEALSKFLDEYNLNHPSVLQYYQNNDKQKKPTIKVSNPLIEEHKINNTTTPLNYENKKYKFIDPNVEIKNKNKKILNYIKKGILSQLKKNKLLLKEDNNEKKEWYENKINDFLNNNYILNKIENIDFDNKNTNFYLDTENIINHFIRNIHNEDSINKTDLFKTYKRKKPTLKVSNPLIEEHKINNTTTPLNYKFTNNDDTEYKIYKEEMKDIKEFIKNINGRKKNITFETDYPEKYKRYEIIKKYLKDYDIKKNGHKYINDLQDQYNELKNNHNYIDFYDPSMDPNYNKEQLKSFIDLEEKTLDIKGLKNSQRLRDLNIALKRLELNEPVLSGKYKTGRISLKLSKKKELQNLTSTTKKPTIKVSNPLIEEIKKDKTAPQPEIKKSTIEDLNEKINNIERSLYIKNVNGLSIGPGIKDNVLNALKYLKKKYFDLTGKQYISKVIKLTPKIIKKLNKESDEIIKEMNKTKNEPLDYDFRNVKKKKIEGLK